MLRSLTFLLCGPLQHVIASCAVVAHGSTKETILQGTILSPFGPLEGGYVHVRNGRIARVGEKYGPRPDTRRATIIDCGSSIITPGFINTHEHIEFSLVSPFTDTGERYEARHEWRLGLHNKTKLDSKVASEAKTNASAWGELRHLFSGTTSIMGHGWVPGLTRNLDQINGLEKYLHGSVATQAPFPLDDRGGLSRLGDCNYGPNAIAQGATDELHRYVAHIGEGVTAQAENEFRCLSSKTFDTTARADGSGVGVDIVAPNLVLIQANSLTEQDFDLIAQRGAKVVWSPRSNMALYGNTLNVTYLLEAGITVALGTDWLTSGSATMSREAYCARAAMKSIYNTTLGANLLWQMMTIDAAKLAGFEDEIGSLEAHKLADIAVWSGDEEQDAYAQAVFSPTDRLELVLRGGEILLAGSTLHPVLRADNCETIFFGTAEKWICVRKELNTSFAAFQSFFRDKYPVILPGVPHNEPRCI